MTPSFVATFLLVPPINLLLLALAGFLLSRQRAGGQPAWWHRAGRILCGLGLAGVLVLALPLTSHLLFLGLERFAAPPADAPAPAAIVILSADVSRVGDAPSAVDVGYLTLERLRAGAALQRATLLPVLVSGGVIADGQPPLAALMAHSLGTDFAVPVRWQENTSRTTWENARNSAALLQAAGIRSAFLVTHAWHMRRALIAFRHFGIAATPAPVPFSRALRLQPSEFSPSANAWADSYYALHEWVGWAWYALRAWS
jgi:uncharacterized SAM-binding protein YcdF (DUF218 family)